jgi:hypothetical protein
MLDRKISDSPSTHFLYVLEDGLCLCAVFSQFNDSSVYEVKPASRHPINAHPNLPRYLLIMINPRQLDNQELEQDSVWISCYFATHGKLSNNNRPSSVVLTIGKRICVREMQS